MGLVDMAHKMNLFMHPWTFRQDQGIAPKFKGDFYAELSYNYCCLRMDALFTEFIDKNVQVITRGCGDFNCKQFDGYNSMILSS